MRAIPIVESKSMPRGALLVVSLPKNPPMALPGETMEVYAARILKEYPQSAVVIRGLGW